MNRHAGEHMSRHSAAHVSGLPAALPTYQELSQTFALDSLPLGAWSSTIPARQGVLFRCLPTQLPRGGLPPAVWSFTSSALPGPRHSTWLGKTGCLPGDPGSQLLSVLQ